MSDEHPTQPAPYSTKLQFELAPDMRCDEAARIIHRFLLGVMQHTEGGVRQDLDPEYLHDYRVALRRKRSALKQLKGVFPAQSTARFRTDFKAVGKLTNDLRDLDVYLLAESDYKAMLPTQLVNEIEPLFDHFRESRAHALTQTRTGLSSDEYATTMRDWGRFLAQASVDSKSASNAGRPIVELASARIHAKYRRIVSRGLKLIRDLDESGMHPLRVQCKELRYMLQFFDSLYPKQEVSRLAVQLKTLQSVLGAFNDYRVQQAFLLDVTEDLRLSDEAESRRMMLATGSLVGALRAQQVETGAEFYRAFVAFASPDTQLRFDALFPTDRPA